MKIINTLMIYGAIVLLSSCTDKTENTSESSAKLTANTQSITDSNVFSGQVRALEKAKNVESLLLETSRNRLDAADELTE